MSRNKKLLAIIIGVVVLAAAGALAFSYVFPEPEPVPPPPTPTPDIKREIDTDTAAKLLACNIPQEGLYGQRASVRHGTIFSFGEGKDGAPIRVGVSVVSDDQAHLSFGNVDELDLLENPSTAKTCDSIIVRGYMVVVLEIRNRLDDPAGPPGSSGDYVGLFVSETRFVQ